MSLADKFDDNDTVGFPDKWLPEVEGETVEGVLKKISVWDSEYGPKPTWVILNDEDQNLVQVSGVRSVLKSEMDASGAEVGDRVAVRYFGQRDSKNGRKFFKYGVLVEKSEKAPF